MALFLRSLALSFAAAADIPTVKLNNGVEMPVLAFAAEAGECHSSGNLHMILMWLNLFVFVYGTLGLITQIITNDNNIL